MRWLEAVAKSVGLLLGIGVTSLLFWSTAPHWGIVYYGCIYFCTLVAVLTLMFLEE